ncbi:MAG: ATP-binding cassette domain-containing protein [Coprobacillus sp.]
MLEIKNISKSYHDNRALNQMNLTLKEGVYALLGPNGSGKSTLMNIICQLLNADQGEILWEGQPIQSLGKLYFEKIGYAPQQQGLYDEFTGLRFLTYMAILKEIPKQDIEEEVKRVAMLVNMQDELKKKCKEYSGGMKQRILVAQALLGNPELLLFDEPTAGLDPKERVSLREVFQSLSTSHILLITTHVVSDVESIAKEIIFLKKGEIVQKGTVNQLINKCHNAHALEDVYLDLFKEDNL